MNIRRAFSIRPMARLTVFSSSVAIASSRLAASPFSVVAMVAKTDPAVARASASPSTGASATLSAVDSAARKSP